MKALAALASLLLLLGACSSSDPATSAEEFEEELLDQIDDAGLPEDLETLAVESLSVCLDRFADDDAREEFTSCYAERLCSSELVLPVWDGDLDTCVAEARASFDFDG